MATSLTEQLADETMYGMQDPKWRQMVYDHRIWLRERSTLVRFDMPDAHRWRYRLQEFLFYKYKLPSSMMWIVLYLNNLTLSEYDGGVLDIFVPQPQVLDQLNEMFLQGADHL